MSDPRQADPPLPDPLPDLPPPPPLPQPPKFEIPARPVESRPSRPPSNFGNLYRMATMGYELVLAIVVMGAVGFGLDWLIGTRPWLLVAGMLVGIVAGMLRFMREARAAIGGPSRGAGQPPRR